MNEKPLTKAVWRTKYKGFPLLLCVKFVGGSVHFVCVCVCTPLDFQGEAMQGGACDELLPCCPYVRDLRNCCYRAAKIRGWRFENYCKQKEKL